MTQLLDERRLRAAIQTWSEDCGRRLRERRVALKLRQEQLGAASGVRATAISKFELGIATPKDSVRAAIACVLMCEVVDIWPPLERRDVMALAKAEAA